MPQIILATCGAAVCKPVEEACEPWSKPHYPTRVAYACIDDSLVISACFRSQVTALAAVQKLGGKGNVNSPKHSKQGVVSHLRMGRRLGFVVYFVRGLVEV